MRLRVTFLLIVMMTALSAVDSAVALTAPSDSAAQQELCYGQAPTIVGMAGEVIVGTEGPDVVVTNGASAARTLGGDDLLCITPIANPLVDTPYFSTGPGNDRMDATEGEPPSSSTALLQLAPGRGSDEVLGGPASVFVRASKDSDRDVISTGSQVDYVRAGGGDEVDVGAGADRLELSLDGDDSAGGTYQGGTGRDQLVLNLKKPGEHYSWEVDTRGGRITREGQPIGMVSGFAEFEVRVRGAITFLGSDVAEDFVALSDSHGFVQNRWPVLVKMRGGNDVVRSSRGSLDSQYNGGDGTDWFRFDYEGRPPVDREYFDMETGALRYSGPDLEVRTRAANFENVRWSPGSEQSTVKGTDGPNSIIATTGWARAEWLTAYGRGGDDSLVGDLGNDVLIGGPGTDSAEGRGGIDRCSTEVRNSCESRPPLVVSSRVGSGLH